MSENIFKQRALFINLSTKEIKVIEVPKDTVVKYIGGRGVNAYFLWKLVNNRIHPLSEDNVLIFGTGPFTGTFIPTAGQLTVTSKSPLTQRYFKCNAGGHWAIELRFAGYEYVIIKGKADRPVYIYIEDKNVEIKDASHLWGKDVRETNKIIKEELGDNEIQVACIGPAGENIVKFASIMVSVYHVAARGGLGAVMGSKKLKAIAVKGSERDVEVAHPELLKKLVHEVISNLPNNVKGKVYYLYGTSGSVAPVNKLYAFPSYNFKKPYFEKAEELDGVTLVERGYIKGRAGCTACPFHCHKFYKVEKGKYACYCGGPEYETLGALGAGCGIGNPEAVLKMHEICNIYGLDGLSAGAVIQWTMECIERGVLTKEDIDGLDLIWGNADAAIELLMKIIYREGFGNILAEGLKYAAEKVGKESWKWAIQARGLEQSRVDTRSAKAYALAFAVNPRGPDHLHAQPIAEFGAWPESRRLIKELLGDEKYANPYIIDKKPELVRWHEDIFAVTEALGLCSFSTTTTYILKPQNLAEMFYALTNVKISPEELLLVGRRIVTLERCYNVREGLRRKDDTLPWRLMHEPVPEGPPKGLRNSPEELDKMLDRYYELHGWDKRTGIPLKSTLIMLGMSDVANELKKLKILPLE